MPITKLRVIPPPAPNTRAVIEWGKGAGPFVGFMRGNGPATYVCGLCGAMIAEGMVPGQIRNIVFRCPKCGSYNTTP